MVVSQTIPWRFVIRMHLPMLVAVAVIGLLLAVLQYFELVAIPGSATPFQIVGVALSVFLAFRNSAAYDRWWEGRKVWGGLVNVSRTFARQVTTFPVTSAADAEACAAWSKELVRAHLAFLNALRAQLRKQEVLPEVKPFLSAEESAVAATQHNVAAWLVQRNGERVAAAFVKGWLSEERWRQLDTSLTESVALQGMCERIKNTPIPVAYRFFTHHFVRVYCLFLPLGLVEHYGPFAAMWVMGVTFVFLVLETIGTILEDPFTLGPNGLPLSALCRTIEINLLQQLGETDLPAPVVAEDRGHSSILL